VRWVGRLGQLSPQRVLSVCGRWSSAMRWSYRCQRRVSGFLRRSLDAVWGVVSGETCDLTHAREVVEEMVPYEDDDWAVEAGYAQNAIAAIAYAARSWLTDDPQEAVWAARQVYEAADYGAQRHLRGEKVYSVALEERLANTDVVKAAVRGISDDLLAAESDSVAVLRQRAQSISADFVRLFP
jgi:hypothetical protein